MLALCQGKTSLSQRGKPFRKFLLLKLLIGHCEALDPWQWYPPSTSRVLPPLCTSFLRHFVPRHCVLLSTFDSPWWTSSRRDSSLWSLARSFTNEETFILLTDRAFFSWREVADSMYTKVYCTWGDFHRDETWKPQISRTWDAFDKAGHGIPWFPAIWRLLWRRDWETPCHAPILVVVFQPRISGCGTAVLFPFANTWVHGLRLLQHSSQFSNKCS